jgi:hypothetical protein
MINYIRRLSSQFFNKSGRINNEPLNKVSLIIIILIDIFILFNVFSGLEDISRWYLSPTQAYPCYFQWQNYRSSNAADKQYQFLRNIIPRPNTSSASVKTDYQQAAIGHLGSVDSICIDYGVQIDQLNTPENQKNIQSLDQKQTQIDRLQQSDRQIRSEYNSTLLEKIAGQSRQQSINAIAAEKAKDQLAQISLQIKSIERQSLDLKAKLIAKPESQRLIAFLQNQDKFNSVEQGYQRASFWHPSIQIIFQSLFLLPLIAIGFVVHNFAQGKRYGLISLISWHLLVIFFIPLVIKIFQFLQVGVIFDFVFKLVSALLGGLLFLVSYIYILVIPLLGFGIIKILQRLFFNPQLQVTGRIQKSRCIQCAKKIRPQDSHCPFCGFGQYTECQHCHNPTYKYLPHCHQCGQAQEG